MQKRWRRSLRNFELTSILGFLQRNWPEPIPSKCEICKLKKKLELCNIRPDPNPETYNRDFKNWWWGCYSCHMESDGRLDKCIERLKAQQIPPMLGKHLSEEHKVKLSLVCKRNPNPRDQKTGRFIKKFARKGGLK